MEFSHECALALVQSTDPFPVNFDDGWQWIGYKRKDTAKNALTANFESGVDYVIEFSGSDRKTSRGGRPREIISLTVDAFKSFCMMAGTEKGKQVRRYFIECERIALQAVEVVPAPPARSTATPSPSLPSVKERLEAIQIGIHLFQQLGGCDPRTELMLKDHIRNILLEEKRKPALPGRAEWPISDRAVVLGHRPTPAQLRKIGKEAARLYQERHGQKPVQREQFVGGATRMVNAYSEADVDILDSVIALVMEAGVTNNLDKAGHPL